jgi:hypothetical protein
MDFADQLQALAARIPGLLAHLATEEATKNALVMPFIAVLGYNVFDPTEVVPEFTADYGTKKGEKVDYAIMREAKPAMLFECKPCGFDLCDVHKSQLHRYFSVTSARIGILTNGVVYEFYSDLDDRNVIDQKPFLVVDMLNLDLAAVAELKRMTKAVFDEDAIISAAGELKYTRSIRRFLEREFMTPGDDFVRFLIQHVYTGRMTEKVRADFTPIVSRAMRSFVSELVNQRLRSAISHDTTEPAPTQAAATAPSSVQPAPVEPEGEPSIITTGDEMEALYIVKAILRETIDPARIVVRDRMTYCGILLDDNNRKPIARLHFNRSQWQISLFGEGGKEERVPIGGLNDMFKYADQLKATVAMYGG